MKLWHAIEVGVNWLFEPTKIPFMIEDGVGTTSNLGTIFIGFVIVLMIAVCVSPKLRSKFF